MTSEHAERAFQINPYTRWVYDHPQVLIPEPSPAAFRQILPGERRARQPLVVELGSGSGNFLMEMAALHRDTLYVGFELRFKRLVKTARKLERLGLDNVWLLRERGERFADYFAPGSVAGVYVNFPDPWPRASQWKKRMISAGFLETLHGVLRPGGWFRLRTDHSGYFLHVLSLIHGLPGWHLREFCNDLHRQPRPGEGVRTEFEQLFATRHKPIFYLMLEHVPTTA